MFLFSRTFPYYGNPLFPCFEFWELHGFLLLAKNVRSTQPWNVLFSQTFLVLAEITSPCFGENTTDVKTNESFLFLIPFPHKPLCETFH